jgi:RNA polymerase sigma-70 factor (ECF subfamily)
MNGLCQLSQTAIVLDFVAHEPTPDMSARESEDESGSKRMREQSLMARASRGDEKAFAALYDAWSGPLYGLCRRILGDEGEAQDALQESFVLLWKRAPAYDAALSGPFTWAVRITRGRAIDRLRMRSRTLRVLADPGEGGADDAAESEAEIPFVEVTEPGAGALIRGETAATVRRGLEALSSDQRTPVELSFFHDFSHQEIAGRLGLPLGTVKARIRRGLARLGSMLKVSEERS